jgi:hypothetical protein
MGMAKSVELKEGASAPFTMETIIKWASSFFVVLAAGLTAYDITPINFIFYLLGNFGWMYISFKWKEWSLFFVSTIITILYTIGYLNG